MRGCLLVWVAVAACGSPQAPPAPVLTAVAIAPPDAAALPDAAVAYTGEWAPFPGCTDAETIARLGEIDELRSRRRPDVRTFDNDLTALLARPCLAHVARTLPKLDGVEQTQYVALVDALREAAHGFKVKDGRRLLAVPPEPVRPLAPAIERDLAPFVCAQGTKNCGRAASYILRAHEAFDAVADVDLALMDAAEPRPEPPGLPRATIPEIPVSWCYDTTKDGYVPDNFNAWVMCIAKLAPRTRRFARTDLTAPVEGWLVLRGRRGHYIAQDEIRAYDLATGAAYIISSQAGAPPTFDMVAGTVAVDQLREVAFMLIAARAVVEVRDTKMYAQVPAALTLSLDETYNGQPGSSSWGSSAQTSIAYSYVDGTADRFGMFTWPRSVSWVENHVVKLINVLEAGLVVGCAPAKLPPRAKLFRPEGRLSSESKPDFPQGREYAALETKMDAMRKLACPGAR